MADSTSPSLQDSMNGHNFSDGPSSLNNNDTYQESCPICREETSNAAYVDGCFHKFCNVCIMEWLKFTAQKPHCPVCRAPVTKIFHNVRSNSDYDEVKLPKPPPSGIPGIDFGTDAQGRRFRFGSTMTPERRMYNAIRTRFFNEIMR